MVEPYAVITPSLMSPAIEQSEFGVTADGLAVARYRLANSHGAFVDVITYGACVTSWVCADAAGRFDDIVLGYDSLAEYEECRICMGGVPGRFANRIAHGRFQIDGQHYTLERNHNEHHLHGGSSGLHKRVWQGEIIDGASPAVELTHHSADGEGGYPGHLEVRVRYSFDDDNALGIEYFATTDKPTVVNLTNHSYFNLRGHRFATHNGIVDHQLMLAADQVLEVDHESIPTGRLLPVADTPFDFLQQRRIGRFLTPPQDHEALYDHCYALDATARDGQSPAVILCDPVSGRCLETTTTLPGVQLYSANHVSGCAGKGGAVYDRRGSVCLEAQFFPDSPNQPSFPDTLLRPGQPWHHRTRYRLTQLVAQQG